MQDPASGGPRGPGSHDQIPPNKPPWFDQPHPVAPWGQQQVRNSSEDGGRGSDCLGCGGWEMKSWLWKCSEKLCKLEIQVSMLSFVILSAVKGKMLIIFQFANHHTIPMNKSCLVQ